MGFPDAGVPGKLSADDDDPAIDDHPLPKKRGRQIDEMHRSKKVGNHDKKGHGTDRAAEHREYAQRYMPEAPPGYDRGNRVGHGGQGRENLAFAEPDFTCHRLQQNRQSDTHQANGGADDRPWTDAITKYQPR